MKTPNYEELTKSDVLKMLYAVSLFVEKKMAYALPNDHIDMSRRLDLIALIIHDSGYDDGKGE